MTTAIAPLRMPLRNRRLKIISSAQIAAMLVTPAGHAVVTTAIHTIVSALSGASQNPKSIEQQQEAI